MTPRDYAKQLRTTLDGTTFSGTEAECREMELRITERAIAAAVSDARAEAIEECARAVETQSFHSDFSLAWPSGSNLMAKKLRALKTKGAP